MSSYLSARDALNYQQKNNSILKQQSSSSSTELPNYLPPKNENRHVWFQLDEFSQPRINSNESFTSRQQQQQQQQQEKEPSNDMIRGVVQDQDTSDWSFSNWNQIDKQELQPQSLPQARDSSMYNESNDVAFGGPYTPFLQTSSYVGGIGPLPNFGSGSKGFGLGDSANQRRFEQMTGLGEIDKPRRATIVNDVLPEMDRQFPGEVDASARILLEERARALVNPNNKAYELPFVQQKETSGRSLPFDGRPLTIRDRYTAPVGLRKGPQLKARPNDLVSVQPHPDALMSTRQQFAELELRNDRATHNERKPMASPTDQNVAIPMQRDYRSDPIGKLALHPHTDRFGSSMQYQIPRQNEMQRRQSAPTPKKMGDALAYQGAVQPTSNTTFSRPTALSIHAQQNSASNSGVRKQMTEQHDVYEAPLSVIPALAAPSTWSVAPSTRLLNPSLKQAQETARYQAGVAIPNNVPGANMSAQQMAQYLKPSFQQSVEKNQYQGRQVMPNITPSASTTLQYNAIAPNLTTFKQDLETFQYQGKQIELANSTKNANIQPWISSAVQKPSFQQTTEQDQYQGKQIDASWARSNHLSGSSVQATDPSKKQWHEQDVFMPSAVSTQFPTGSQSQLSDLYRRHHLQLVPAKQDSYADQVRGQAPHSQHLDQPSTVGQAFSMDSTASIGSKRHGTQENHTIGPAQSQQPTQGSRVRDMLKTMRLSSKGEQKQQISSQASVLGAGADRSAEAIITPRLLGTNFKEPRLAQQEQDLEQVAMRSFQSASSSVSNAISNLPQYELFGSIDHSAAPRKRLENIMKQTERNDATNLLRLEQLAQNPFVKDITKGFL